MCVAWSRVGDAIGPEAQALPSWLGRLKAQQISIYIYNEGLVMRSNHQRIHERFQLVQLLGLELKSLKKLSMEFFKLHGLRWTSRGFVIIKSKPWLIWFMFKRVLLVEPRPLHKDWEKKTRFGQLTFRYSFGHTWSYKSNFDVILVVMEARLLYISNSIWHAF